MVQYFVQAKNQLAKDCKKYSQEKDTGVSKNRGTQKWMVYNGKPY